MTARVLVVDDVDTNVKLLEARLVAEYFEVSTAHSGAEALQICSKEGTDVVLLDIMMPDMSGWDVYQRIRKVDKKTKIAFLSAIEVSPERRKTLLKTGLSDYITKPFLPHDLVKRINKIVKPNHT